MSDIDYLLEGIPSVCGPKASRINQAKKLVTENSNNIGLLVEHLNRLCGGNFISKTNLQNIIPTKEVSDQINLEIINSGGRVQSEAICGKVGTLGSFYSCTSQEDSHPVLVATGSELCSQRDLARQKCTNWAASKFSLDIYEGLGRYTSIDTLYGSLNATGPCFSIIGFSFTPPGYADVFCNWALDH